MEIFRVDMKIIGGSSLCNCLLISILQKRTLYSCDFFFFICYGHFEVTSLPSIFSKLNLFIKN